MYIQYKQNLKQVQEVRWADSTHTYIIHTTITIVVVGLDVDVMYDGISHDRREHMTVYVLVLSWLLSKDTKLSK